MTRVRNLQPGQRFILKRTAGPAVATDAVAARRRMSWASAANWAGVTLGERDRSRQCGRATIFAGPSRRSGGGRQGARRH